MNSRQIRLWLTAGAESTGQIFAYRMAACDLTSDIPLPALDPFRVAVSQQSRALRSIPSRETHGETLIFDDTTLFDDVSSHLRVSRDNAGYWVDVAALGTFFVSGAGDDIVWCERSSTVEDVILPMVVLGPLLAPALALNDVWCLHASAVLQGNRALAFIGESGQGKSTLAAFLDDWWPRLTDDMTPVSAENMLYPQFPQLKLSPAVQAKAASVAPLPLAAIYLLRSGNDIAIERLSPAAATLALARHTVAARLFDRVLLAEHLAACSKLARTIPVATLSYPRRFDILPQVRDILLDASA